MIRIYSGWSNPGGSTVAFINLTNALNKAGYETIFYGPHDWHLDKCKAEKTSGKMQLNKEDTLIAHFTSKITSRPPIKNVIFSCHEQNLFPLKNINFRAFDKIHFVSEHQKQFHGLNHPSFIIPNILDDLKANTKPIERVVGIIGSIDRNKQVHLSIRRALEDGFKKILIFGSITDQSYWQFEVLPLVDNQNIIHMGHVEDKQKMYDMITDVYFSSKLECLPYVLGECIKTNTVIHGLEDKNYMNGIYELDNNKIVDRWVKELDLFEPSNININKKPKISAYFPCYNEAKLLPHLLRYYTSFCDKVTILDNFSTDNTEEVVKKFPNVIFEKFDSNGSFNDGINAHLKNNVWKRDIGNFDYVIAADSDEFIWHPNFVEFLQEKRSQGYTLFRPFGYHMVGDVDLDLKEEDNIFDKVKYGIKVSSMDKYIMFDCNKIKETNFSVGSHSCNPIGEIKLYYSSDLKIKHFKYMGLENHLSWCRIAKQRLSQYNIQNNMGTFYLEGDEYHTRDYMNYLNQRVLI